MGGTESAPLSAEELEARYEQERVKRLTEGVRTYRSLRDLDVDFDADPYTPRIQRDVIIEETDVVIVGTGWAGMSEAAYLTKQGVTSYRMLDKAGDFGGTWYWNRYPGCMCDVESYTYLPLLEEVGYMPTKKYAHAPEIFEYAQLLGRHFDMYPHALFHTEATGDDVGRGRQAVDGHHRPRRPAGGALRRHLRRRAPQGQAARHPRHRDLPGPLVPHEPLGLRLHGRRAPRCRWTSCTTRRSASSAPAPPPSRPCPSSPRRPSSSTCSSARRRR